jgi:hypothetical protein
MFWWLKKPANLKDVTVDNSTILCFTLYVQLFKMGVIAPPGDKPNKTNGTYPGWAATDGAAGSAGSTP